LIAAALAESAPVSPSAEVGFPYRAALRIVAKNLANRLLEQNPAFDRARFLRACGVES
jgi:hypothetical protein